VEVGLSDSESWAVVLALDKRQRVRGYWARRAGWLCGLLWVAAWPAAWALPAGDVPLPATGAVLWLAV
jgi:hypothetical protein